MSKGQQKTNRETKKPKKTDAAKASGGSAYKQSFGSASSAAPIVTKKK